MDSSGQIEYEFYIFNWFWKIIFFYFFLKIIRKICKTAHYIAKKEPFVDGPLDFNRRFRKVDQKLRQKNGYCWKANGCGFHLRSKKSKHLLVQWLLRSHFWRKMLFLRWFLKENSHFRGLNRHFMVTLAYVFLAMYLRRQQKKTICVYVSYNPYGSNFCQSHPGTILPLHLYYPPDWFPHYSKKIWAKDLLSLPEFLQYTKILNYSRGGRF